MNITIANMDQFEAVRSFYHAMIDEMKDMEYKPAWEKGVYPSDAYLMESMKNGTLWVCEYGNGYAAAMIVNHESNEGYKQIKWSVDAEEHEVTVIHALGVMPSLQGKGIAKAMVRKALEGAQETGQKAVRLDVLGGNIPAERLYVKCGFQYIDTVKMFYEDTGWTDFKLYEYPCGENPENKKILTHSLLIRKLLPEDWRCMKQISEDFKGSEYAIYDMPFPTEDAEIQPLTKQLSESGMFFAVCLRETSEMIGYICFRQDGENYDLGFSFLAAYHGKGYAFESCRATMEYLQQTKNVSCFTAGTALNNVPACKLLERLGFMLVGTETLAFHKDDAGNDISFVGGKYIITMP